MISTFLQASSLEEALRQKAENGPSSMFIAGGTEINRLGTSVHCSTVISLKKLGLNQIVKSGTSCTIGSCSTFQSLVESAEIPAYLKESARYCGSLQRRNMATIGGNVVLQRDDSYLMPTLVAAKARLLLANLDQDGALCEENIPIREYLGSKEHFADSLLLAVILNKPTRFVASLRFARTVQSPAAVTLALGADLSSGSAHDVRICAAVKGSGLFRLPEQEEAISNGTYEALDKELTFSIPSVQFVDDATGSQRYKRYMLGTGLAMLFRLCVESIGKGGAS